MGRNVMLYVKTPFDGTRSGERTEVSRSHRLLAVPPRFMRAANRGILKNLRLPRRGKPYFPACPQIHFSISHSGAVWACAMAADEIGLDVQKPRAQNAAGIARRFFHPLERAYLERWGADAFFRVWAAKESVCKYRGTGIDGTFSHFSVSDGRMPADAHGRSTALSFYAVRGIRRLSLYGGRRGLAHGVPVITAVRETPVRGGNHAVSI